MTVLPSIRLPPLRIDTARCASIYPYPSPLSSTGQTSASFLDIQNSLSPYLSLPSPLTPYSAVSSSASLHDAYISPPHSATPTACTSPVRGRTHDESGSESDESEDVQDGFALLLKAAEVTDHDEGVHEQDSPTVVCGDYNKPVTIGHGTHFTIDLTTRSGSFSSFLMIEHIGNGDFKALAVGGTVEIAGRQGSVTRATCRLVGGTLFRFGGCVFMFETAPVARPPSAHPSTRTVSLGQGRRTQGEVNDASGTRPAQSWASLIIDAFKSTGKQYLLVSEIYAAIAGLHPYYGSRNQRRDWKNGVRHALSVNTCFFRLDGGSYKCGRWGFTEKTGPTTARRGRRTTHSTLPVVNSGKADDPVRDHDHHHRRQRRGAIVDASSASDMRPSFHPVNAAITTAGRRTLAPSLAVECVTWNVGVDLEMKNRLMSAWSPTR
ncbi:hypothetical protein HKX48_004645 [Thoreauomyces humboldtii]|nr:hypothetical protein HKX48_004645 [Thoreauomyces humboldtii]